MSETGNWILLVSAVIGTIAVLVKSARWASRHFSSHARLQRKAERLSMPRTLLNASEEVLSLAVHEEPPGWEFLLFSELLEAEIRSARSLRLDIQFGRSREGTVLDERGALDFANAQSKEMISLIERAERLFNDGVNGLGVTSKRPVDLESDSVGLLDLVLSRESNESWSHLLVLFAGSCVSLRPCDCIVIVQTKGDQLEGTNHEAFGGRSQTSGSR